MSKKLIGIIWKSMDMMEEYFHKMGGSGRYPQFEPIDMPLTVIVIIAVRFFPNFEKKLIQFVPADMFNESHGFLTDIEKSLDSINDVSKFSIVETIIDFMNWIERQKGFHNTYDWVELKKLLHQQQSYLNTAHHSIKSAYDQQNTK